MISSFEPIIGSGFDQIAAQRAGWAGFNKSVDEGNIARANEAERTQNDWLRQVAALQVAAQNRDLAMAQEAEATRRAALQRREDLGLGEKYRAEDISMAKDRLAAENARTEKMGEVAQTNLALKLKQADDAIEQRGQTHANSYLIAKNNAEAANLAYDNLQKSIKSIEEDRQKLLLKPKKTQVEQLQINDYANKLKVLEGQSPAAKRAADRAENNFQGLVLRIQNQGYEVDSDNNRVIHPPTGKSWNFKTALSKAKVSLDSLSPPHEDTYTGDDTEGWASAYGPTSGTGTSAPSVAAPVAAPAGMPRVRRYNPVTDSFE
jgi:hypothetical protein